MAAPAGMTLSEASSLNRLTHLCTAIGLTDTDLDPATKRALSAQVKAVRLFVQAEEREMAKASLAEIVDLFVGTRWEDALARKVSHVRKMFRWEG